MIGILIGWLICGILLIVLSSLLYYYNTFGLTGLIVILPFGILILLISTSHFLSWQKKGRGSEKPDGESLKNAFILLTVISILVFFLGVLGYLLGTLGIYNFDLQTTNTLIAFITIGILAAAGGILSWVFVERSMPGTIGNEITEQINILDQLKRQSEVIETEIRSKNKDVMESIEGGKKIVEGNKEELERE